MRARTNDSGECPVAVSVAVICLSSRHSRPSLDNGTPWLSSHIWPPRSLFLDVFTWAWERIKVLGDWNLKSMSYFYYSCLFWKQCYGWQLEGREVELWTKEQQISENEISKCEGGNWHLSIENVFECLGYFNSWFRAKDTFNLKWRHMCTLSSVGGGPPVINTSHEEETVNNVVCSM